MRITRYQTVTYDEEVPKSLEGFRNWEFSSGGTTGQDFKIFARLFKKEIERQLPGDVQLLKFSAGHYYVSGFIYRNNRYVYFSISDVRHFPGGWYDNILIRTAKSDGDYTGGCNNYTQLRDFGEKAVYLLGNE